MKTVLKSLYVLFLILAGMLLVRIIFSVAQFGTQNMITQLLYAITDVVVVPVRSLIYGDRQPMAVLDGVQGGVEPSEVFALFIVLIVAFAVSAGAHAVDKRKIRYATKLE